MTSDPDMDLDLEILRRRIAPHDTSGAMALDAMAARHARLLDELRELRRIVRDKGVRCG